MGRYGIPALTPMRLLEHRLRLAAVQLRPDGQAPQRPRHPLLRGRLPLRAGVERPGALCAAAIRLPRGHDAGLQPVYRLSPAGADLQSLAQASAGRVLAEQRHNGDPLHLLERRSQSLTGASTASRWAARWRCPRWARRRTRRPEDCFSPDIGR